jgi:N-acetylglucosaminyl-diphospho-decaprenol L-rhamnosyltransferase
MTMCIGLLLNYRDVARTIKCVESLLDSAISRVVVWDNSADSGVAAAAIRKKFAFDDRVIVDGSDVNLGFAAGVNRGLLLCMAIKPQAWVLLINNDATLLQGGLEKLQGALFSKPKAGIAFPDINHAGTVRGGGYYHRLSGLMFWKPVAGSFLFATGCCLLVATDRFTGPLFDEDFFMYGEDVELGWRLAQHPGSIAYVHETLVEHEGSASSGMASLFYESHVATGHLLLALKLARGFGETLVFLSARLLILTARASARSLRYRTISPWVGLVAGIRRVRRIAHTRHQAHL